MIMERNDKTIAGLCINTVRTLSMDAVQKAKSGHPGAPMGLAPVAYLLWDRIMNYNPSNPRWAGRDRFILSAGHASMMLYSILHITGYDISMDDIKSFRQLGSKCPGHPEYGDTPGVETTTGPLGQGAATSVGFAIAGKWLSARYDRPGFNLFGYRTFVILGDGCMMEGITCEAASLAGHLGLNNLVWIFDNNHVSLAGPTSLTFTEDVEKRFIAYEWNVLKVEDVNDLDSMEQALVMACNEKKRPTLIIASSHIGYGAPTKQDTFEAHGSPLGDEELKAAKRFYGWDPEKQFYIPPEINDFTREKIDEGNRRETAWNEQFQKYARDFPGPASEFKMLTKGELPEGWESLLPRFDAGSGPMSGRKANGKALNSVAAAIPWMIGGSADLDPSTLTVIEKGGDFEKDNYSGRNIHYGTRENAMVAISSGLALNGLKAYAATFFIFSDYARSAIRLAALMKLPVHLIFTHDSIGLGEDGPTHQAVEHLASLRAMPGIELMRPADAGEVSVLWRHILTLKARVPVTVVTRQDLPVIDRTKYGSAEGALKGGYILAGGNEVPEIIMIGTGSEVQLCLQAHEALLAEGIRSRVVSMPCWSLFERQDENYRGSVLPASFKTRLAVEAGSVFGWERYVGNTPNGRIIGMNTFGTSAPGNKVMEHFGFTVENVLATAKEMIGESRRPAGT
jgi:transketolase